MTDTLRVAQQDRETLQYLLDGLPDDPLTFTMERGALQRALARLSPPAPASSPATLGEVVGWVDVDGYVWQRDERAEGERYMRANKRSSVMRPAYAPPERPEGQESAR